MTGTNAYYYTEGQCGALREAPWCGPVMPVCECGLVGRGSGPVMPVCTCGHVGRKWSGHVTAIYCLSTAERQMTMVWYIEAESDQACETSRRYIDAESV